MASAHLGQVTADTRDGRCRAALRYHAQTQRQAPRGDTDEHAARGERQPHGRGPAQATRTVAIPRPFARTRTVRTVWPQRTRRAMRRCGRACRRTTTARGLVPPTRATNARTAPARRRPQPRRRGRGAVRAGRAGRAGCPGARRSGAGGRARSAHDDDVPGEPGGIPRAIGDREHEVVRSGEQRVPRDPVHDVARLPHVLDGRAVELEVDGRRIDAGAVVGHGHGVQLRTSPSPNVEPACGSGLPNTGGRRVGHREARAPDGAIADGVDCTPRQRVSSGGQSRCRPRGGAARSGQ